MSAKRKSAGGSNLPSEKEPDDDKFEGVLSKTWKVFRVSPLYNFSKNNLKFYEEKLNQEIKSKKKITTNADYKSKFTLNKNLRLNDECAEAIQVEIVKNDSKHAYLGYFISWSNSEPGGEDFVSLPILLVEGKAHETSVVHSSLCKIFDCDIQPVAFSFNCLISFFVKLLEVPRNNLDVSQVQITLEYGIPGCEAGDKIKINLFLQDTILAFAVVMDTLKAKYDGITSTEIISAFYNKILNHIYEVFKMDLTFAKLQRVSFPDAFLTSNGQRLQRMTRSSFQCLLSQNEKTRMEINFPDLQHRI